MHKFFTGIVLVALIAGMATLVAGCRSTKKIQKVIAIPSPNKDTVVKVTSVEPVRDPHADSMQIIQQAVGQMTRNKIDFQTFSAKMHVHYEGSDGKDYEVNAVLHMKKDSMIWVSVNVALGIEAFRLLITRDSVKLLDKLKKIARLRSVSYLQQEVNLPVDFYALQDLLIGNPIFFDTAHINYYKKEQVGLTLFSIGNLFSNYLTLNPGDNTLRHSKLDDIDPLRVRTCDMTYGDYDGQHFSTYRKISVSEKSKVDIEFSYKQYKFNEALSFNFSVPKNYKRR